MGNSKVLHPYLYQQRNKNGPFARRRGRHATAERARLSGKTFQRTFRMAARRDAMQQKSPRTSRVGGLRNQMHGGIGAVHADARRVWQPRCHGILVRPEALRPCFSVRYALKAAILLRFRPSEFAGMRDSHPIGQKIRRKCGNTCSNDRGNYRNNGSSVVSGRRRNVPLNAFDCRGYRRL